MGKELLVKINEVKKLVIKSLFADDELMDLFVLKGGNALEIAYEFHSRASKDVDVSMEEDFHEHNLTLDKVEEKIKKAFKRIFSSSEYTPFDFEIQKKPNKKKHGELPTWGGYCLLFKVIEKTKYSEDPNKLELIRKMALPLGKKGGTKFSVDISRFEYTKDKEEIEFEDIDIYVYTPLMIINEKLRAICQQMNEYTSSGDRKPRPKDFFDIYVIFQKIPNIEERFLEDENLLQLREIFNIKDVPMSLLNNIKNTYAFHLTDYPSLKDTVGQGLELKEFEFYFNYVIEKIRSLNSFWEE